MIYSYLPHFKPYHNRVLYHQARGVFASDLRILQVDTGLLFPVYYWVDAGTNTKNQTTIMEFYCRFLFLCRQLQEKSCLYLLSA